MWSDCRAFQNIFCSEMSKEQNQKSIKIIMDVYKDDINVDIFEHEFARFSLFLKENKDTIKTIPDIQKAAKETSCTFPNIEVLLIFFRTIPLRNASGERWFSVLKRWKNYLRSTVVEDRVKDKALLYIEKDILNHINADKIIDEFTKNKARRKCV